MNRKPLILFDLDGVLVDTARLHFQAWKNVAAEYGIDPGPEVERRLRGLSREHSFAVVFGGNPAAQAAKEQVCTQKNRQFLEELDRMPADAMLVPNALALLDELRDKAVLAVASGSRNARPILQKTGIAPRFKCIIDGSIESEKKPDPAYYLNILHEMDAAPHQTILFEDSEACIASANRLGIRTIAVNCPATMPATLHTKSLENISAARTLALVQA